MAALATAALVGAEPKKVLVFSRCEGFNHRESIAACKEAMAAEAKKGAFTVDFSDDYAALKIENLLKYDALVLNNTTALRTKDNPHVAPALCSYVRWGGGLCALHAAADCFYDAPECSHMVGGQFKGHPWGAGGTWAFKVEDRDSPLTAMFRGFAGGKFTRSDEIYQQASPFYDRSKLHVLITLDRNDPATRDAKGQVRDDKDNAVSWIRAYGKGRVFYTTFAHDRRAWNAADTRAHVFAGLAYTLGTLKADDAPSATSGCRCADTCPDLVACAARVLDKPYTGADWRVRDADQTALGAAFGRAVEAGDVAKARPFAEKVFARADLPDMLRACAARVLLAADAENLAKVLGDPSKKVREAAFGRGLAIPPAAFAKALAGATPELKRAIVARLVQDGATDAAKDVAALTNDADESVATAAAAALGTLGGADNVETLLALRARGGAVGMAAEEALVELPGIGELIFDKAAQNVDLLSVAARRAEAKLLPRWQAFLTSPDAKTRKSAWKALGKALSPAERRQASDWFLAVRGEEASSAASALWRLVKPLPVKERDAALLDLWRRASAPGRAEVVGLVNRASGLDAFDFWEKAGGKAEYVALADKILAGADKAAAKVDKTKWRATASRDPGNAGKAFDGKPETRWASGWKPKGQWFALDLGESTFVESVTLDVEKSPGDTPKGGEVYISQDGVGWTGPVATCDDKTKKSTTFTLGRAARHLKFVALGEDPHLFWSIHEIEVKAGVDKARLDRIAQTAAAFKKELAK